MTSSIENEIEIFGHARLLPDAERISYLIQVCGTDINLRKRVEELLAASEDSGAFLERPPLARSAGRLDPLFPEITAGEKEGDRIGNYLLLEKLGEGGCGVVYLAEQLVPVRRRVALKIIKLGMDTKSVIARFEAERQTLAILEHPNIARVLDAGATEPGRPFFVMELVTGIKITDYCDDHRLPTRQRIELFIQVCQALQHAHEKGIIHRDLKPSNILVTEHNGVPSPKVIDFGIAKATDAAFHNETILTQLNTLMGTPAYMSPEQADMSHRDIDTRSDIYSLGVVLYELLTGQPPFDSSTLLAMGIDGMRATIREKEPARPSTTIASLTDDQRASVALRQSQELPCLVEVFKGELDWIVIKCLEKDRARRYESASSLADDLRRFLNEEPVSARPPSQRYRVEKWIRRNKAVFTAITAAVLILIIGSIVATWEAFSAIKARNREAQARKDAESVSQFMTAILEKPVTQWGGERLTLTRLLDRASERLNSAFATQPAQRAELQRIIAGSYLELGLISPAIRLLQSRYEYFLRLSGPANLHTVEATVDLASAFRQGGQPAQALNLYSNVLGWHRTFSHETNSARISAMENVASVLVSCGRPEEAIALQEKSLSLWQKTAGTNCPEALAASLGLARIYLLAGSSRAQAQLEGTVALMRKALGDENPQTVRSMVNLAEFYFARNDFQSSAQIYEVVYAMRKKHLGEDHPSTAEAASALGFAYDRIGRNGEAYNLWKEAVRVNPDMALTQYWLAAALFKSGRYTEAIAPLRAVARLYAGSPQGVEALERLKQLEAALFKAPENDRVLTPEEKSEFLSATRQQLQQTPGETMVAQHLAIIYLWLGMDLEHEQLCRELFAKAAESDDPFMSHRVAKSYLMQSHPKPELLKEAEAAANRALKLSQARSDRFWFVFDLAMIAYRRGNFEEAIQLFSEPIETRDSRIVTTARYYRSLAFFKLGKTEKGKEDLQAAEILGVPPPRNRELTDKILTMVGSIDEIIGWLAHDEAVSTLNLNHSSR